MAGKISIFGGGSGDVIGPATAIDEAIPLFDGITGKFMKDSTRLVEDIMTDGSDLPDGHAINDYFGTYIFRASNYDDLATAISEIGATEATLIIDSAESLPNSATFPSTLSVVMLKPGYITIASAKTLTINGSFDAYLGYIFRGDGGGNVTGSPKMKAVYPQWFGATGDGVTDDSSAIEKAISASISMGMPCYFPKMIYDITSNVNITSPQALLIGEGTLLDGYLNVGNTGMGAIQNMHIKIEGLSFDNDNGYGLVFQNSYYIEVLNCKFYDNSRAIYFKEGNTAYSMTCHRILVSECEFFTPDYAIYSDPRGGGNTFSLLADIEFSSNRVYRCQITHFYGRGVDGAIIANNYFYFPGRTESHATKCSHVDIDYASNIIISGNHLFEAGLESIKIGHFQNIVISNNIIWGPGQRIYTSGSGIKLYDGDTAGNQYCSGNISGNTIWRPTKHGIEITGTCGFIGINNNYLWGPGDTSYYYGSGDPGSIAHYGCYAANTTQYINVVGNYFHDGIIKLEGSDNYLTQKFSVLAVTANQATFNITGYTKVNFAQTSATNVTNLTNDSPFNGQILYIKGYNGNTTLDHNDNASNGYMIFNGGADVVLADKKMLTLMWATNHWEEVSRSF